MGRKKKAIIVPLETIWEIPDVAWERLQPILVEAYPPQSTGRGRIDFRQAINGLIFRMRTGCQWNHLPKMFGDDSSIHRWFQRWVDDDIFVQLWAILREECDELGGVDGEWQAVDGCLGKARFGGEKTGRNPTDRGKSGTKKSLAVEADGGPLGVVIAGANIPDVQLLEETLEAIVVERPEVTEEEPQHLCLDKGYDQPLGHEVVDQTEYTPHIRPIGEKEEDLPPKDQRHPARRWVVERTLAWLQKCRGILIRYDKKAENYLGLIQLACALLWFRRLDRLCVLMECPRI